MKHYTILFVDDEHNILNALVRSLQKFFKAQNFGYAIAHSAYDALKVLRDNSLEIPVIVSDQRMPDLKGSELAGIIREKRPDIVFIILSGHTDTSDIPGLLKSGVHSFIEKPWDNQHLEGEILSAIAVYESRLG